jgi:hypothetical protein
MINAHCLVAEDTVKIVVICRNVGRENECSRDVQVLDEWCYSADGKSGSQVFMLMAWKGCKASITTDVCRVFPLIGSPCRIFQ